MMRTTEGMEKGGHSFHPMRNVLLPVLSFLLFLYCLQAVQAEVLDRIVAIVNDQVILQSEYQEAVSRAGGETPGKSVLDSMIDRILLFEQARKLRISGGDGADQVKDEELLIREYIDRRIRSFIYVPVEKIESYYLNNRERYEGRAFYEAKDDIERQLVDDELKDKLAAHIAELRKKAYIRIQVEE